MVPYEIGMSRPEHDIYDVGKFPDDRWQCVEDIFNPFVWRKKAKRKQDRATLRPKLVLIIVRIRKWNVWNPVRD